MSQDGDCCDSKQCDPPKCCHSKECTHKEIVAQSITVRSPEGHGSVAIMSQNGATGVWVQTGQGQECVALVAERGVGPYLAIYGPEGSDLPLAVSHDQLQLPSPQRAQLTISFADLLAAVRQVLDKK